MMNTKQFISIIAISSCVGLFSTAADAQRGHTVDCESGDSIQAALDKQVGHAGSISIDVTGTCEESVLIKRDDVTINGNNNATVIGTISIHGGNRIEISRLTVTGPGRGVEVLNGNANLYDLTIINNALDGIWSIRESWVGVHNSVVSGSRFGAFVQGSTLESNSTEFANNYFVGIQLDTGANAIVRDSKIYSNGQGINNALHSVAQLESGTEITGNGTGVWLAQDSGLRIDGPGVIISGNSSYNLRCNDSESSYTSRDNPPLTGNVNCTDFNQIAPTP